jgi:hypothetical protein
MADKDAIVRPLARAEPPVPAGSEDPAAVDQRGLAGTDGRSDGRVGRPSGARPNVTGYGSLRIGHQVVPAM